MIIFPNLTTAALVLLVQPKNTYYMVISQKLSSAARVPQEQRKNRYHMVIVPKLKLVFHDDQILS